MYYTYTSNDTYVCTLCLHGNISSIIITLRKQRVRKCYT